MNTVLAILGSLGGVAVFIGAVWSIIRVVFKQIGAVEANTRAIDRLTAAEGRLDTGLDDLRDRVARLEGRRP